MSGERRPGRGGHTVVAEGLALVWRTGPGIAADIGEGARHRRFAAPPGGRLIGSTRVARPFEYSSDLGPYLLEGPQLRQDHFLAAGIEPPEHLAHGVVGTAARFVEIDFLALEVIDRGDAGAGDEMHLEGEQPGDGDDLSSLTTPRSD